MAYEDQFSLYPALTQPRIKKNGLLESMFDRMSPQGDAVVSDEDKRRMGRQGLLAMAAAISRPNGGNFTNSIATGLLAGSQSMNIGQDDLAARKYKLDLAAKGAEGPSDFRTLDLMARSAGFQPGSDGYKQFMLVKGGLVSRQSSAAIQYKQQMGADGVMRYVAFDPNEVGAQVIGSGETFGAPVGRPQVPQPQTATPGTPQFAPPQAPQQGMGPTGPKNDDAIIAQANQFAQAGMPSDQIDAWVRQQQAAPVVLDGSQPQQADPSPMPQQSQMPQPMPPPQAPQMRAPQSIASPFQSRPEEDQKALSAAAEARAKLQVEQSGYAPAAAQAGAVEAAKVRGQVGAESSTAGMAARTAGTIEASKQQGQDAAKVLTELQAKAQMARTENNNLQMLRGALQNTYTGVGANAVLGAKRAAAALGIDVKGLGEAEAARALSNKMALAMRNPSGGEGMPGAMSDKDLAFLQASNPSLQSSPAGWKALVNQRIALNQYAIDQAQYAERLRMSGVPAQDIPGRLQAWADAHPIFHPKKAAAPQGGHVDDLLSKYGVH